MRYLSSSISDPEVINNFFLSAAGQSNINSDKLNFCRNNRLNADVKFKFEGICNDDIIKPLKTVTSRTTRPDNISTSMIRLVRPYCINEVNQNTGR